MVDAAHLGSQLSSSFFLLPSHPFTSQQASLRPARPSLFGDALRSTPLLPTVFMAGNTSSRLCSLEAAWWQPGALGTVGAAGSLGAKAGGAGEVHRGAGGRRSLRSANRKPNGRVWSQLTVGAGGRQRCSFCCFPAWASAGCREQA